MNRLTDQALRSLLPTHNGALPEQLAGLAGSLLAQSRHRASTLKAEEEIARPYACAHIACERLKTSLDLPPIEARPPIQPRLYKRLYTHLSTVLQPTPAGRDNGRSTPRKLNCLTSGGGNDGSNSFMQSSPLRRIRTPSGTPKTSTRGHTRPLPRPTPTPQRRKNQQDDDHFPAWLRPVVRSVCDRLEMSVLAPTIMAGLTAIRTLAAQDGGNAQVSKTDTGTETRRSSRSTTADGSVAWVDSHLTVLTAAICYYCRVAWRDGGGSNGAQSAKEKQDRGSGTAAEARYKTDEQTVLAAFTEVRDSAVAARAADDHEKNDWESQGWREPKPERFRRALLVVSERGWLQSDWFRDIQQIQGQTTQNDNNGDNADGVIGEREDEEDEEDAAVNAAALLGYGRSDSMLQPRYDFLSESRQQAYETWRTRIVQQLQQTGEAMQVDAAA